MYKNRISRPTHNPAIFTRRSEIAFDERLPYIESVLETLIESRFGPGSIFEALPVGINLTDRQELEPAPPYDMFDDEPNALVPFDTLSTLGRAGYQLVEAAYRRAKQMGLVTTNPNAHNSTSALPPNQGRGYP